MSGRNRQLRRGLMPWSLLPYFRSKAKPPPAVAVAVVLVLATVAPAVGQTHTAQKGPASLRAADLFALRQRCGAADPLKGSFQLFQQHACGGGKTLAFEENRLFIYALADASAARAAEDAPPSPQGPQRIRRFFLLKPSTFVVEDVVRDPAAAGPSRWSLQSSAEPQIEHGRIRVVQAEGEILAETLLPPGAGLKKSSRPGGDNRPPEFRVEVTSQQASGETRFLYVFHLRGAAEQGSVARSTVAQGEEQLQLTVTTAERVFRLTVPSESSQAGEIEVAGADGKILLPRRRLPSGVMPHGPEGTRLLQRWDAPYRANRPPGWDVGRPCTFLTEAVEDGTLRPSRAIVLGCGSGTNAIYLARKGFDVTGVDVAPTALAIAGRKARKLGVNVRWMVADVLALPKLEPFDLIFDRGCYHHIQRYNSAGYVETVRRLSHGGTRILLLAGNANEERHWGPPRVKEEKLRDDFSALYEFEWLREIHFEMPDPDVRRPLAWSVLLRRKDR